MKTYPFTDHDLPPRPKPGAVVPCGDYADLRGHPLMPGGSFWMKEAAPRPWINRHQLRKRLKSGRAPIQTAIERGSIVDYAR